MEPIKPYKKEYEYSYALGAFPTFELLKGKPEQCSGVYIHSTFTEREKLAAACREKNIPVLSGDKTIARVSDKENVFVVGVYEKYSSTLDCSRPHLMLVNPSNMGNLGTILRTCLAMGIQDLAIVRPGVDIHHPKVVRASMGAVFSMRIAYFDSYEEYAKQYVTKERSVFTFMLNAKRQLDVLGCPKPALYTLVFGNEATGLPDSFLEVGESLLIPQSPDVDSLNLTIAVGIGTFLFTHR